MLCFVGTPLGGVKSFAGVRLSTSHNVCLKKRRFIMTPQKKKIMSPMRMGLVPFVPNWALIGGWVFGSYRFFKGFKSTDYQPGYRIPLALLWPIFMVVNANFRANFMRAYRNPDDY